MYASEVAGPTGEITRVGDRVRFHDGGAEGLIVAIDAFTLSGIPAAWFEICLDDSGHRVKVGRLRFEITGHVPRHTRIHD